jgi:hypothetical protein
MLSQQQISDRLEIQEIVTGYGFAVDNQDWELWDQIFTEDAVIDYTDVSDHRDGREATKQWLMMMPRPGTYYHLIVPSRITVDGDNATSRSICYNPMPSAPGLNIVGHWYDDTLRRTPDGWRITSKTLRLCYQIPLPDAVQPEVPVA